MRRTVVGLGDSVTSGVGDVGEGQLGWAAHLAHAMHAQSYLNLARMGARARDVRAEQLPRAVDARADLATLLVGGNDVLRADFAPSRVADDVAEMCARLRAVGTAVMVVLLHDPRHVLPRGGGPFGRVLAGRAGAVNENVCAALSGGDVIVVHVAKSQWTYERANWSFDRMHPSPHGHRRLAREAAAVLREQGWATPINVPDFTDPPPGRVAVARWLLVNGTPWLAKRSVDLVPELVSVVWQERHRAPAVL